MRSFIVFDLDGTLLNTLPDIAGAMNRVLFRYGLPQHPEESYKLFTGDGARVLTQRALAGQENMLEHVYSAYLLEYSRNSRVDTRPYEGIREMLLQLLDADIKLIVFSNKDDPETKSVIAHYFPDIHFTAVLGSQPGVPLKPDPAALLALLEEHELSPSQGLYVGDTVTDMQCARAAEIPSVAVLWGFQPEEMLLGERPDAVITAPSQLIMLLEAETPSLGKDA
jgi:phosphoglycolate phosphatase